jgi:hypothetical protein
MIYILRAADITEKSPIQFAEPESRALASAMRRLSAENQLNSLRLNDYLLD